MLEGFIPDVAYETGRRALCENGISYQRHRTWKYSNDPEFHSKWERARALYAVCPKRSAVVCVDKFGPLECRPYIDSTWAGQGDVPRLPATYSRPHGVRHTMGFYDVHADVLDGFFYSRKHGDEFIDFVGEIRKMYPPWMQSYIVLDNFSPHKRNDAMKFARKNRMEFVFTATNASWMNRRQISVHALLDQRVGSQLQRTMRQSPNPDSSAMAAHLIQSGLGVSAERLAEEFAMELDVVRVLIVSFNARGTKALTRKRFGKVRSNEMAADDRRVIEELIRLTPRAFDLPDNRWLASEIVDFVKEHHLVDGIDEV